MMLSNPKLEQRPAQHYAAICTVVPISFGKYLVPLWDEIFGWLKDKGVTPFGPSMIRYLSTNMSKRLDIDVGFTLDAAIPGDERITVDTLPAGRYVTLLYTGPYQGKGVFTATAALLEWAQANNIAWSVSQKDGVEWWNGRIEFYLTDPDFEHDTKKYQTELVFLTRS